MGGRQSRGEKEERRGTTEPEHPLHAVAAQPHFATSILPARLHSHSVDPFTEGMSHMPLSSSSSLLPSLSYSLLFFKSPRSAAARTPRRLCLRQSHWFSFYLIPSSILLLHPCSPTSSPPPPPLLSLSLFPPLSLFLSFACALSTKVSLFLSISVV